MSFFRFTRVPKHQQFEYKPRYWNPEKEELEQRLKRLDKTESDPEAVKSRIASGFRNKGYGYDNGEMSFRRREAKRSNYILLAIVAILLLVTWFFLTTYLPQWASLFE